MRDLISSSYKIDATELVAFDEVYYIDHGKTFTYIIPVGDEKHTIFFHLLKFISASPNFKHLFTVDNKPTILIHDTHFFVLSSTVKLHQTITAAQLNPPVLYQAAYPFAAHFKTRWLYKNQIHEQNLNLALDKTPPMMKSILFDLATYYTHLNEEAYRLVKPLATATFTASLCHVRLKPDTPLSQFFMPTYLTLDNRSRVHCEYLRHLYLESNDLGQVEKLVARIARTEALNLAEWQFLYARLYFPTHFYDIVYDIITSGQVSLENLYEQTMTYSKLLASLPPLVQKYTNLNLELPEWTKLDTFFHSGNSDF